MAILRPSEEVEGEVDGQEELQPPDFSSGGDEVLKVTELETADPKITTELQDLSKSKGQDESNSSRENSDSASTSDKELQSMSKLQLLKRARSICCRLATLLPPGFY